MRWAQGFSQDEIRDLVLASIIIGFIAHIFIPFRMGIWYLNWLMASIVACGSYAIHGLSQKIFAEKLKFKTEFKLNLMFAIGSLVISVLLWVLDIPLLILVVGGVSIKKLTSYEIGRTYQGTTKAEMGKIGFVGLATNIFLAVLFKILEPLSPVFTAGVYLNLWLAMFNTLPLPQLDGLHVLAWSLIPWSILFSTELVLLLLIAFIPISFLILILIGLWLFLFLWLQKYTKVNF